MFPKECNGVLGLVRTDGWDVGKRIAHWTGFSGHCLRWLNLQVYWTGNDWLPMVFFSSGKGGGEEIAYGFKGKGTTTHLLVDGNGSPVAFVSTAANGDERQQVEPLLDRVQVRVDRCRGHLGNFPIFEADKGYDTNSLREKLLRRKIFPWICRRRKPGQMAEKIESVLKRTRWKVERAISWLQRKFRRLAVRWERRVRYWKGFLTFGLVVFWINRLVR